MVPLPEGGEEGGGCRFYSFYSIYSTYSAYSFYSFYSCFQRFFPDGHWFADAITVDVHTDEGPVVFPSCWLQVYHAATGMRLLKMEKPPSAVGSLNESALMRAVDIGAALFQYHTFLVWTIDVTRAQNRLPTSADAALGNDEIVVAVTFHHLRALCHGASVDRHAIV